MNCCYNCNKRHAHCHVTCEDYKKFAAQNAVEREKRGKETQARQGVYYHYRQCVDMINKRKRVGRRFYGS